MVKFFIAYELRKLMQGNRGNGNSIGDLISSRNKKWKKRARIGTDYCVFSNDWLIHNTSYLEIYDWFYILDK